MAWGKIAVVQTAAQHGLRCGVARPSDLRSVATPCRVLRIGIDNSILDHRSAVKYCRISVVEYLFGSRGGGASVSPERIEETFARMRYDGDDRRAPGERWRGEFRAGWEDVINRGQVYNEFILRRLTWHNLGYRFGQEYGESTPEYINETYEVLAALWERVWGPVSEQSGSAAPSAEQYMAAFQKLGGITDTQVQMIRLHYHAPERTITATQMAHAAGYNHHAIANSQYGGLGRLVGDQLEYNPMKDCLGTLVTFEKRQGVKHWLMRPQVAEALDELGWVEGTAILLPEEIAATTTPLVEGAVCRVSVNAYERNPEARRRCIQAHGTTCAICAFIFGAVYGEVAEGYIHVHHLRALSEIDGEYVVDPVADLRPVCANCHAVLHRRIPAYSIEEVRAFLGGRVVRAVSAEPDASPDRGGR